METEEKRDQGKEYVKREKQKKVGGGKVQMLTGEGPGDVWWEEEQGDLIASGLSMSVGA